VNAFIHVPFPVSLFWDCDYLLSSGQYIYLFIYIFPPHQPNIVFTHAIGLLLLLKKRKFHCREAQIVVVLFVFPHSFQKSRKEKYNPFGDCMFSESRIFLRSRDMCFRIILIRSEFSDKAFDSCGEHDSIL